MVPFIVGGTNILCSTREVSWTLPTMSPPTTFVPFFTVGLKLAQLCATWNLFGEKISAELRDAKDNSIPLTLHEIETIINQTLTDEELSKIKSPISLLGSASVTTAVMVELIDGGYTVFLIRRPNIKQQIKSPYLKKAKFPVAIF